MASADAVRRERHRAEREKAEAERAVLVNDHSCCEICGKRFYDPRLEDSEVDPLEREEDYLVHFMAEHMIDELKAGNIDADDVESLAEYLEVSQTDRRRLVLGLSKDDADSDPLLKKSVSYHSRLQRIDRCFAVFFTMFVLWVVYLAQFGGETSTLGNMASKGSGFVLGGLVNGVMKAAQAVGVAESQPGQELAGEL